jgi:tRNA(fMet)-specific endonuclease VapC
VKYCLDSNICISFLNNTSPKIAERLKAMGRLDVAIPSMVKAELLWGAEKSRCRAANLDRAHEFLRAFEIIPFCSGAAEIYSRIRTDLEVKGQPIGPNDLIVAATTLTRNAALVTNNEREFSRVPGLRVENWA